MIPCRHSRGLRRVYFLVFDKPPGKLGEKEVEETPEETKKSSLTAFRFRTFDTNLALADLLETAVYILYC